LLTRADDRLNPEGLVRWRAGRLRSLDVKIGSAERPEGDVCYLIMRAASQVRVDGDGRSDAGEDLVRAIASDTQPEREDPTEVRPSALRIDAEIEPIGRDRVPSAREWMWARDEEALRVSERALHEKDDAPSGRKSQTA
jgi:hypothetical protein